LIRHADQSIQDVRVLVLFFGPIIITTTTTTSLEINRILSS
jgi:hypothetical protein